MLAGTDLHRRRWTDADDRHDHGAPFAGFDIYPSISDSGMVSFSATLDAQWFSRSDRFWWGISTSLSQPVPLFSSFDGGTAINATGRVAFFARYDAGGLGIFSGNGGPTTTIADSAGEFSDFGLQPVINAAGTVAFEAALDIGGQGIFTGDGDVTTTIADSSGLYKSFINGGGGLGINNTGMVVFFARLDDNSQGIFAGPDPVADRVIGQGDALFGGTVSGIGFLGGLNDDGEIAFRYTLIGGKMGIAVATPNMALPGDYNANHIVDAADYIVWRRTKTP